MVRLALAGGRPPEAPSEGFPCLLAVEGPEQDRRWAVEKDVMTIGRGHACDVQVFGPTLLARCAVLERVDDGWSLWIEPNADVRVAGVRSGVVPLYGSEEIVFGQTVLSLLAHELDEAADRVLGKPKWRFMCRMVGVDAHGRAATVAVVDVGIASPRLERAAFDDAMRWVAQEANAALDGHATMRCDDSLVLFFPETNPASAEPQLAALRDRIAGEDASIAIDFAVCGVTPLLTPELCARNARAQLDDRRG